MTKITITINCENEAFQNGNVELARIIRDLANEIEAFRIPETLYDINGNRVGIIELK